MRLKTKLSLGIGFLFIAILVSGVLGIHSIYRLKHDAKLVLKDNYETLVYSNNMLRELDGIGTNPIHVHQFEENLRHQEANITEPGEGFATVALRQSFDLLKTQPGNDSLHQAIRQNIQTINESNQRAIFRKNEVAGANAEKATTWLMIIFSTLSLVAFTLAVNFPSVISTPVKALAEGIKAIVNKDYSKRIHLQQKDEFGELAQAFNTMAEKLDEYEHSNIARIMFEKSRIETIINQMTDGIIGLDEKSNILFLNVVAEKLLGLKQSDIIGKYAPDIALKNDLMRTLLLENTPEAELKIFADFKESYFHRDVLHVKNNDTIIGQVVVLRNITHFHELNEAKTNFIATISHELKTPIASIKMSAQLLADNRVGGVNTEQQELVQSINDDANRLLKITSELLNMSQVETGHIQLRIEPVSPAVIIGNANQAVHFLLAQKQITLKVIQPDVLPMVHADAEKSSWVLTNFLTNAIKYSGESSVIELKLEVNKEQLSFTVRDYGKGIEEKYLLKVFDRYFKVPGSYEKTGTGLGLSISKEFIEAQSGRIWASSSIGEGSSFGFSLPVSAQVML